MKMIDARSGEVLTPGKRVAWGQGEWLQLNSYRAGLFLGVANITVCEVNYVGDRLEVRSHDVAFPVRYLHPAAPFQRIGIIPS